jgi:hypothetical protein
MSSDDTDMRGCRVDRHPVSKNIESILKLEEEDERLIVAPSGFPQNRHRFENHP